MKTKKHYFLMISCPSDVVKERNLLEECVKIINKERTDDVWVELQYWATDTSSDAGMLAQDSINEQIVHDSDGLIAIFNARLGTPVHEYKCGTDEEIALMLKAKKHVSLLFNTRPTIDLSHPNCIEQITKLQDYKNEQSKKAYYREFFDEDSFITLARREILLWLRKIINESQVVETPSIVIDNPDAPVEPVPENKATSETSNQPSELSTKNETTSDEIDNEAGMIDCVVYIVDAAVTLTDEINNFGEFSKQLNESTTVFNDKMNMIKKQGAGGSAVLVLCKKFASEINTHNQNVKSVIDKIEIKWNQIYQYLLVLNKSEMGLEDKVIVRDSITSLKSCFEETLPQINLFLDTVSKMPNLQKELKKSVNNLASVYRQFKAVINRMIDDCEELDILY